jgi:LysR family transcriptional regulator, hydrogen peroxide-inducible genes activator
MDPTLQQLRYVVALADHRHFGAAASACHVSQPALSAQIREVERRLGAPLFERRPGGVLVTGVGEVVISRARSVLRAADELLDAVALADDRLVGPLRLAAIPTVAPYVLPRLVPVLRRMLPDVELHLSERRSEEAVRGVASGELHLGLLATPADTGDLHVEEVAADPFVVALPEGHPLLDRPAPMTTDCLADLRVLLLEEGHCLRRHALEVCAQVSATTTDVRGTSMATLIQMVAAGMGATLLPASAVPLETRAGNGIAVRAFDSPPPGRSLALVWRPTNPAAARYSKIAEVLRPLVQTPVEASART